MTPQPLGQHFLGDAGWRARILDQIAPSPGDVWVEIGAGGGEMTCELAGRVKRLIAIELDARMVERLRAATEGLGTVEIVSGDVLALDLVKLAGPRFRVYGSLPYYITSPILRRLFSIAGHIDEIDVVIQLEVAQRVAARPRSRDYGWLTVLAQYYTRPEILLRIPPGAFRPPPKVESALVRFTPPGEKASLGIEDEGRFLQFAATCFAHKRKTLVNNLKARYGADPVREALAALGLEAHARAEELPVAQIAALFLRLHKGETPSSKTPSS
jgi:16S rRNA (adenine1518-N6/adenine1519-N6)-dimethyltransferase